MIGIRDLYANYIRKPLPDDCGIICEPIDSYMATLNRLLTDSISYFSYTLVVHGNADVDYNGTNLSLSPGEILITTPGARVFTNNVSADYFGLCLMVDETIVYEIPDARLAVLTAYSPSLIHSQNKLSLNYDEAESLKKWMNEIMVFATSDNPYAKTCRTALYSIFVCELMNVENKDVVTEGPKNNPSELFLNFLKLLPANYLKHHELKFYADRLSVSTIYLSRIVKKYSNQTVKDHIDRLLLSEASVKLRRTKLPIANIAESLNFANPQSFCKFYVKHRGISPREYRNMQTTE